MPLAIDCFESRCHVSDRSEMGGDLAEVDVALKVDSEHARPGSLACLIQVVDELLCVVYYYFVYSVTHL